MKYQPAFLIARFINLFSVLYSSSTSSVPINMNSLVPRYRVLVVPDRTVFVRVLSV